MSLPNYQSKLFHFVIGAEYVEYFDSAIVTFANAWGYDFAYILHDKDNEYIHYHLIVCCPNRVRISTILKRLQEYLMCDIVNISVRIPKSFLGAMHYLIHMHDKDKYQYELSSVVSNFQEDYLKDIYSSSNFIEELTTSDLINIVLNAKSDIEIIMSIGIGKYTHYRPTINDIKEYKRKHNL